MHEQGPDLRPFSISVRISRCRCSVMPIVSRRLVMMRSFSCTRHKLSQWRGGPAPALAQPHQGVAAHHQGCEDLCVGHVLHLREVGGHMAALRQGRSADWQARQQDGIQLDLQQVMREIRVAGTHQAGLQVSWKPADC